MYTFRDTYKQFESYEVNNSPSETQPNMSMSIYEILTRHSRNLPIPSGMIHEPQYSGNYLHPLSRKGLDLADRDSIIDECEKTINDGKAALAEYEKYNVDEMSQLKNTISKLQSQIDGMNNPN